MDPGRHGKARVGVVTILPVEFDAACYAFGTHVHISASERVYAAADLATAQRPRPWYEVVVVRAADRGNSEAQHATNDLIEQFRPDFLFLCGIAGGLAGRDNIGLGDAVVANYIHYGEYMKLVEDLVLARHSPYDQPSRSMHDFLEPVRVAAKWCDELHKTRPSAGPPPKVLVEPILSGEKVLSSDRSQIQQQLVEHHDNAVAVEMEAYGFAKAVYTKRHDPTYNPQLLVVRGISDLVPSGDNVNDRKVWAAYAAEVAARLTYAVATRVLAAWPIPHGDEVEA